MINANLLNEARFAYLNGDPVTRWEAQTLSTTYTREPEPFRSRSDNRDRPIFWAIRSSFLTRFRGRMGEHYLRFGGSVIRHTSGGTGSEPGTAILGTFTFNNTTPNTLPFGQLTLADVQNYTQPIDFGINSYRSAAMAADRFCAGQLARSARI